jgi:hypothetical protein
MLMKANLTAKLQFNSPPPFFLKTKLNLKITVLVDPTPGRSSVKNYWRRQLWLFPSGADPSFTFNQLSTVFCFYFFIKPTLHSVRRSKDERENMERKVWAGHPFYSACMVLSFH